MLNERESLPEPVGSASHPTATTLARVTTESAFSRARDRNQMKQVMLHTQRPRHDEKVSIPVGVRRTFSTLSSIYNSKESRAIENHARRGTAFVFVQRSRSRRDLPGSRRRGETAVDSRSLLSAGVRVLDAARGSSVAVFCRLGSPGEEEAHHRARYLRTPSRGVCSRDGAGSRVLAITCFFFLLLLLTVTAGSFGSQRLQMQHERDGQANG